MIHIKSKLYPKIFFSVLFLGILLLAFYITKPFLPALITGAIIAYLLYPLYKKILRYIKNKNLVALIVSIFVVLLFTIILITLFGLVSKQAYETYISLSEQNFDSVVELLPEENLDYYLQEIIKKIVEYILENASKFLALVPSFFLNFFVMIFALYYMLRDGERITERIKGILPLKETRKQHVLEKFHNITYAVFYGNISIAILQGILGGIGFLLLGVPSAVLWGFVMILFALIPYFGTAIIWLPAALNLIFLGYLQNDSSYTIRGIVLIAYGIFVIGLIDNMLKPKLIGIKAKVHPILILLGVLGGLSLFGFIGLILGPVILALLVTFVDIYEEEKENII